MKNKGKIRLATHGACNQSDCCRGCYGGWSREPRSTCRLLAIPGNWGTREGLISSTKRFCLGMHQSLGLSISVLLRHMTLFRAWGTQRNDRGLTSLYSGIKQMSEAPSSSVGITGSYLLFLLKSGGCLLLCLYNGATINRIRR